MTQHSKRNQKNLQEKYDDDVEDDAMCHPYVYYTFSDEETILHCFLYIHDDEFIARIK